MSGTCTERPCRNGDHYGQCWDVTGPLLDSAGAIHMAILGGSRALCGSTDGPFTVSEIRATCEECLRENEIGEFRGTFPDDHSDY